MRSHYIPAIVLMLFASVLAFAPSAHSAIRVQSGRLGNVFLTDEIVQIPLTANGTRISWKVTDYFGNKVAEGQQALTNGRALIQPASNWSGLFRLAPY